MKVALVGFGTVGSSVAKVLDALKLPGLELTVVYNRGIARKKAWAASKFVPKSALWPRTSRTCSGRMRRSSSS